MQNYTKAWPWNFLFDVFEDQVEVDKIHRNPPQDLEDTVLHVILTMQTHCFQSFSGPYLPEILVDYYTQKKTLKEISKEYKIPKMELSRQKYIAILLFKNPLTKKLLQLGMKVAQQESIQQVVMCERQIQSISSEITNEKHPIFWAATVPIQNVSPNLRIALALVRSGIRTIGDMALAYDTTNGLEDVRSIGKASTVKLLSLLKEKYDVTLPISDAERAVLENVKADSNLHDAKVI